MKILLQLPFAFWFYNSLSKLKPMRKRIREYRKAGDVENERKAILEVENQWVDAFIERTKIDLNVEGEENIPEGAVLIVSNHQSYFDIPVILGAIRTKQIGFIAKKELARVPGLGQWVEDIRGFFIERENPRETLRAFETGQEWLKSGFSLAIFPEGTRSRGKEMGEFKKGSLRMAIKAGVKILPVTISGSYKAYEETGFVRSAKIDFIIHETIDPAQLTKAEQNNLVFEVESIVRSGLEPSQRRPGEQ